ncbi:MAG: penicillin-binding protein 2 [Patescibacteria group bacterium]
MSIFDLYDDQHLPGDKTQRNLRTNILEYEHFDKDATGGEIFQEKKKSLWFPYLFCFLAFGVLLAQLLRLQIAQGSFNKNLAEGNRTRIREVSAPRGLIYDSGGKILAQNKASFNLEIYPLDFPKKTEERAEIYQKLSSITQIPEDEIKDKVTQKGFLSYEPIILKENIDRDTAMILEYKTINLPGVIIAKKPIREYSTIAGLGPIIGYISKVTEKDLKENLSYKLSYEIGRDGLESFYEKYLRGNPGLLEIEVDSHGRQQRQLSSTSPLPGNNLTLSVDAELEEKMMETLSAEVKSVESPGGSAIAINPKTGQILGMVSYPTFDNNIFTSRDINEEYAKLISDPSKPMFNRAISGTYPSGSIIKPIVAAVGLQEGIITERTTINDPGEIKVGSWVYPDWKNHGLVDIRKAIAESCNVFFYSIAGGWDKIKGLGVEKLDDYLVKFGFQDKTGIDLPSEAKGNVPSPQWKEKTKKEMWYLGDTYHLGIGQGDFLITPLEMAVATSAIVNGGELLKPQIVSKITDQNGQVVKDFKKEVKADKLIDDANLQVVREGMRQAVTGGSAQRLNSLPVAAAAKTGTAQFGVEGKTHAWMTAFAPYNDPQIVIVTLVEEGGEGYAAAGPVVYDILNWYFSR